ncbi:Hsp20 family protein [Moritella viscosa]|uniref:Heat shock protein Hsp20 n=1 Tax=Moritella viscosa TaxID=80854 RepID=A0ABY1HC01_9GAMM|nr:Hsp20 family protein [Moritella viscosa]CED58922.1 small heat shock protein hspH [Moritella viscosa]SGY84351.1 Heat shock protein Hsp20 [Moritella viscosa]SGY85346.1 Heat shock protein Hsp20 [Moritella viscosa]SGY86413.1 Heat shock protein Hsp20 [Moritella viscosa]SHN98567.1 Heat shock protein Hsp20 [Moritella viscosa]
MNTIDLTPLYRSTIGFDRLAPLFSRVLGADNTVPTYPPYNIEILDENKYTITVAAAGFSENELDINVEKGLLTISGDKVDKEEHKYLYQGIANRAFKRKFDLTDYVEVTSANLEHGLLTIHLVKEIPEAMKPKHIAINQEEKVIEHQLEENVKIKTEKTV